MEIFYLLIYIGVLSIVGFVIMGLDKRKAKRGRWRIAEKTIFLVALFGGSAGATLGMHVFHHKTKHWYFKYGLPAIFMLQAATLAAFFYWKAFLRH